jgi:glutathione-regulated potassium-efflux system ancillary protein KefG
MNQILILFAHPRFEKSRTNRALLAGIEKLPGVTLNDLYEQYPDFNVDIARERELLLAHQVIVWHHPFYMYSAPALLKQWIDLVLEHGWAHGRGGDFLSDKIIFNTLTAGGTREVYAARGFNRFTIRQLLAPFEQTANLCKMKYLPPFAIHGTHLLTRGDLAHYAQLYRALLMRLGAGEISLSSIQRFSYLNDWFLSEQGELTQ